MNTVITLVAVAFLGQGEPLKTYPGAPGAYGQCKTEAARLRTTQHKALSEYGYRYRCNIKWKNITDPTKEPGFKDCMGRWFVRKTLLGYELFSTKSHQSICTVIVAILNG